MTVQDLHPSLQFVSDSQDTEPIREHFGDKAEHYGAFFVAVSDGDYTKVWGMLGTVPYNDKNVYRVL